MELKIPSKVIKKVSWQASEKISEPEKPKEVEVSEPKVLNESIVKKTPVIFENAEVIKVLEERRGFVRCEMSNGTTMDVPEQLFNK